MIKKLTSSILAFAVLVTMVFGGGNLRIFAEDTGTGKIVVYVAFEGKDNAGHEVNIGKTPVQVAEGTKADVAVKQVLEDKGYKQIGAETNAAQKDMTYDLSDSGFGTNLNALGGMKMDQLDETTWVYWAFYLNGKSSQLSLGNVELTDGDEISYLYTSSWGDQQCSVFEDDNSKDPDEEKQAALIAAAKEQRQVLADKIFDQVTEDGMTVCGMENPNALYTIFSLIRAGYDAQEYFEAVYEKVAEQLEYLRDTGKVFIDGTPKTESELLGENPELTLAKIVLFVTAMGRDASNIRNVNLIEKMADKKNYEASKNAYMLDCTMLLAFDSADYELPAGENYITRADLVNKLVSSLDDCIGIAVQWSSVDSAVMPIQPLFKYTKEDNGAGVDAAAVKKQTDKVLLFLEKMQGADGFYGYSVGDNNAWSLAQVMLAASNFQIPLASAGSFDFIKNGVTLLDAAAAFVNTEEKMVDENLMGYQPEQLLRGLDAAIRFADAQDGVYCKMTVAEDKTITKRTIDEGKKNTEDDKNKTDKNTSKPDNDNKNTDQNNSQKKTTESTSKNKCTSLKAKKNSITVKKGKKVKIVFAIKCKKPSKKTTDKVKASIKNKKKAIVKKKDLSKKKLVVTVLGKKKGTTKLTVKVGKKKAVVKIKVK